MPEAIFLRRNPVSNIGKIGLLSHQSSCSIQDKTLLNQYTTKNTKYNDYHTPSFVWNFSLCIVKLRARSFPTRRKFPGLLLKLSQLFHDFSAKAFLDFLVKNVRVCATIRCYTNRQALHKYKLEYTQKTRIHT